MTDAPGQKRVSRKSKQPEEAKSSEDEMKLDKKVILQAKNDLKELLGRDPTVQEVAKFLKAMRDGQGANEQDQWTKLSPDLVKQAQHDLKELLGREPTAKEVQKFLTDMQASHNDNNVNKTNQEWFKINQDHVNEVQKQLKERLGRDPTAAEVQDELKDEQAIPAAKSENDWTKVNQNLVNNVKIQLKIKLGRDPTAKEVQDELIQQQQTSSPSHLKPVNQHVVDKAQSTLKAKLNRAPTTEEVEKYLKEQNAVTPAKNVKQSPEVPPPLPVTPVNQQHVNDSVAQLKKKLGRNPTPQEVEKYLKETEKKGRSNWTKIDPDLVKDVENDLKEILGRDPTAKEVEDFLKDLQSDTPSTNQVDSDLVKTATEDLRELMGREPTAKEVEDFLNDLQEDDNVAQHGRPVFGNPLIGFELEQHNRYGLPGEAYTAQDAIAKLKMQGYSNPTDAQINEWLFEHNEGFVGLPSMENEDIPGITTSYISPPETSILSSTNIFILFLVMVIGGLFYKMRKKNSTDDEYVKQDANNKDVYEKFFNPFNRKNDKDDDFDKIL